MIRHELKSTYSEIYLDEAKFPKESHSHQSDYRISSILNCILERDQNILISILDSVPDLIYFKNTDFIYMYCNKSFEKFVGLERTQIIGSTDYELFDKYRADIFKLIDTKVYNEKSMDISVECLSYLDGKNIYHETIRTPCYDSENNLIGFIGISRDITRRKAQEEEIQHLNYYDALTKLYNRRFFEEEKKRYDQPRQLPISIIFVDVDGLKLINDMLGYEIGDNTLIEISSIIKKICRREDIISRVGGDEFCILLPKTSNIMARKICDRIQQAFENKRIEIGSEVMKLSISIGNATKISEIEDLNIIIKDAEDLMIKRKLLHRSSVRSDLMNSIKAIMIEKSHETAEHAERLIYYSKIIGESIGLSDRQLFDLELTAALHDIGKMCIDHKILLKKGKLTDNEWAEIRRHPELGYRIARATTELISIAEYILHHHERWDGNGYPEGLKGEEIPIISRIISIVDSFDAMTEDRAYRCAISKQDAINEIINNAGTQFDPELSKLFIKSILVN